MVIFRCQTHLSMCPTSGTKAAAIADYQQTRLPFSRLHHISANICLKHRGVFRSRSISSAVEPQHQQQLVVAVSAMFADISDVAFN